MVDYSVYFMPTNSFQLHTARTVFTYLLAKLIHRRRRYDHITPLLRDLHWLKSPERVDFKLAVIVYKCLHSLGTLNSSAIALSLGRKISTKSNDLRELPAFFSALLLHSNVSTPFFCEKVLCVTWTSNLSSCFKF